MAGEGGIEKDADCSFLKMADSSRINMFLDNSLEDYGGHNHLRTIIDAGLRDSDTQRFIVDASKFFASVYDQLKIDFRFEGCDNMLSDMPSKYEDKLNLELEMHFSKWYKSRKQSIEIIKATAERLDLQYFIANIAGMIGSFVEILSCLNLGICITSYAYNISSNLGLILENALELIPHIGFVSSFINALESQVSIKHVVKVLKNDKDMFQPLKQWLDETKEFDDLVKNLFPYRINKEIIKYMEITLEDLEKEQKIFSSICLSNLIEDPTIHENRNFTIKAFLFSISDAAKIWYKRLLTADCSLDLDCDTFYLHSEYLELKGVYADPVARLELGKLVLYQADKDIKKSDLGRLVILCLSGMSIYYCYQNIRTRSKYSYSEKLRELSTNAQSFLHSMEKIRFYYR